MFPPDYDPAVTSEYTFKELSKIAKDDPEKFESMRRELIDKELVRISNGDDEKLLKLRQFQWRLDNDKELRNVQNDFVKASILFNKMNESLNELNNVLNGRIDTTIENKKSATIKSLVDYHKENEHNEHSTDTKKTDR